MKKLIAVFITVFIAGLIYGCATNPTQPEAEEQLVTPEFEKTLEQFLALNKPPVSLDAKMANSPAAKAEKIRKDYRRKKENIFNEEASTEDKFKCVEKMLDLCPKNAYVGLRIEIKETIIDCLFHAGGTLAEWDSSLSFKKQVALARKKKEETKKFLHLCRRTRATILHEDFITSLDMVIMYLEAGETSSRTKSLKRNRKSAR